MRHVESLFFGKQRRLFAMYHPATTNPLGHGVLLCPPLFHEYYRCHFALRRIATGLADRGYDVLRFDYSGTGDSEGSIPQHAFDAWSLEIGEAIDELGQLGGYKDCSAVAVRFAAMLASPWKGALVNLVGWDPVFDAQQYFDEISLTNAGWIPSHLDVASETRALYAEIDFLGTGESRSDIERNLLCFTERLKSSGKGLTERWVGVESDVDWQSTELEMVHPHDTIEKLVNSL